LYLKEHGEIGKKEQQLYIAYQGARNATFKIVEFSTDFRQWTEIVLHSRSNSIYDTETVKSVERSTLSDSTPKC
jgi:hypothetical protein